MKYHGSLSLIVPFFNEEQSIIQRYKNLKILLSTILPDSYELIFVNDGSKDKSLSLIKKEIAKDPFSRLISYKRNRGRGFAVKKGFLNAKYDLIGYTDADTEISETYIVDCLESIRSFDGVIASKYLKGSSISTTRTRYIASIVFNWLANVILSTGISDHQAGLKIFKRGVVEAIINEIKSNSWFFDIEFLYLAKGCRYKICEIPIRLSYGHGKIKMSFISGFFESIARMILLRIKNI